MRTATSSLRLEARMADRKELTDVVQSLDKYMGKIEAENERLRKESQERHDWWIGEKLKAERLEVEKKSLDAKVLELQRQVKQANADEHNALSVVDRLKGELGDTQKSLDASRAKRADLLDELQRLRAACRLTDGELEALDEINRDRMSLPASAPRVLLANFVGRVRAAIETPNAANASAGPGSPTQRLKAVEQELALVWQVVNAMADEKVGHMSLMASTAIQVRDQARAERGRE